jgi:hypothetical protein
VLDPAWRAYVAQDGNLECEVEDVDVAISFDTWREDACEHPGGILVHHYLGNITSIDLVRTGLRDREPDFPVIFEKVIYSATHCGDRLELSDVARVSVELTRIGSLRLQDERVAAAVAYFNAQMSELVAASKSVGKPIAF